MIVIFASTAGLTGAEIGVAGGTAVVGQKILEAVFGDQAVRRLAETRPARPAPTGRGALCCTSGSASSPSSTIVRGAARCRRPAAHAVARGRRHPLGRDTHECRGGDAAQATGRTDVVESGRGARARGRGGARSARRRARRRRRATSPSERAARLRLSADHTIVALAGATGSGKSSLFNGSAASTSRPSASSGRRRRGRSPARGVPTAPTRSSTGSASRSGTRSAGWGCSTSPRHDRDLQGLVLLDLPDHDSTEVSHHLEVERLVKLADVFIWVLDPQKYADAAIHDRFLRAAAASHADVMMVAFNHIDEIPADQVDTSGGRRRPTARRGRSRRRPGLRDLGDPRRRRRRAARGHHRPGRRTRSSPATG